MRKGRTIAVATVISLALAACASTPPRTGTNYQCDRGTRLTVNYLPNAAIVRVNGRQTMTLRATPANMGQIYENKSGARLHRNGNGVTWNTALRSAPESCRVTMAPL
ncbi:MliC family protein [Sphingopyxis panaciterrae]